MSQRKYLGTKASAIHITVERAPIFFPIREQNKAIFSPVIEAQTEQGAASIEDSPSTEEIQQIMIPFSLWHSEVVTASQYFDPEDALLEGDLYFRHVF